MLAVKSILIQRPASILSLHSAISVVDWSDMHVRVLNSGALDRHCKMLSFLCRLVNGIIKKTHFLEHI